MLYFIEQSLETYEILVNNGADVNFMNEEGTTPLDLALCGESEEIWNLLIQKADINRPNKRGSTLLHKTVYEGGGAD